MHSFMIFATLIGLSVSAPVKKEATKSHKVISDADKAEELAKGKAQDQEYFRYLDQVITVLEKDKAFIEQLGDAKPEDIASGKVADQFALLNHNIRNKLDEVKRKEVENQRELLRQKKEHIIGIDGNSWNPINSGDKETFQKEDLEKLLTKHHEVLQDTDRKRREEFHSYEMEKEYKRRKVLKSNFTKEEERDDERQHERKTHQPIHQPGHKAELEEVWEKQDGLDPEGFDTKTLFKLHDKNDDGFLDSYELETFFLTDLEKVYNSSEQDFDAKERAEESARMREYMMESYDDDKNGLVSLEEFMSETNGDDFDKDDEWKSIVDEDQFSDKEMEEYEKTFGEDEDEEDAEDHNNKPEERNNQNAGEHMEDAPEDQQDTEEHGNGSEEHNNQNAGEHIEDAPEHQQDTEEHGNDSEEHQNDL